MRIGYSYASSVAMCLMAKMTRTCLHTTHFGFMSTAFEIFKGWKSIKLRVYVSVSIFKKKIPYS